METYRRRQANRGGLGRGLRACLALVLAVVGVLGLAGPPAQAQVPTPTPTITASNATLAIDSPASPPTVGASLTQNVNISIDSPGIVGAQFGFTFDPAVVQVDSVDEATFFFNWQQSNPGQASGTGVSPNWAIDNVHGTVSAGAV